MSRKMKNHAEIAKRVIELAVRIQQVPAPTFFEQQRSALVQALFTQRDLADVTIDELGNVFGRLPGTGRLPAVVFSAHMDTVFPMNTDLTVKREAGLIYGPGIGDNSLGVAGLCGLADLLHTKEKLPGDVWLVADVCEEGLGDLKGMKKVVERFGARAGAYVVVEGTNLERIYHRAVGVERYRITVRTPGGHSWSNFGKPSAIHELAFLIEKIGRIPLPAQPHTTWNAGRFEGGVSINTIAPEAHLELDLRSESAEALENLAAEVKRLAREANRSGDDFIKVEVALIGERPPGEIPVDHPLVCLAARCVQEAGITPVFGIGSTDANIPLSQGLPAVCMGLTRGGGVHTVNEFIETEPVAQGLKILEALAVEIFSM